MNGKRPLYGNKSSRHPPHLKGRDIGMWYANHTNTQASKKRKIQRESDNNQVISFTQDAKRINSIMKDARENRKKVDHSSIQNHKALKCSFDNIIDIEDDIDIDGFEEFPLVRNTFVDHQLYQASMQMNKKCKEIENITAFRRKLPSFNMQDRILEMVANNQVSLISGETGCGKTTQIPQLILDDYIRRKCGSLCHIICTQPRRLSTISVAQRVSKERNEHIGKSCGYQIRLDQKLPRKLGSILYCTTGVLLRFMINDPKITIASHIIIDEVHERDALSDFLLVVVKDLLPTRPDFKIILMSATLNANIFSKYFDNCPHLEIPGRIFYVQDHYLENILQNISYNPKSTNKLKNHYYHGISDKNDNNKDYLEYLDSIRNDYPPNVIAQLTKMQYHKIDNDLIIAVLNYIVKISDRGAILVFVPGWKQISNLHKDLSKSIVFSNEKCFKIIPLHSRLPTVTQREVFEKPPPGCRKIVISTNIAETSITIDDIVYVIDCGKDKESSFNIELNVTSLDECWISKASEKQRKGRAGRVQDGHCFHLYTMYHQSKLREFQLPEILQTPLNSLCLQIKVLRLGKISDFLSKCIEPPSAEMCERAINELVLMRALDDKEELTSLGHHLALLPVSPNVGRMILYGAIFSCLDPILTIAASLDTKDPFITPLGKEKEADKQKYMLAAGSKSDHIALINAFRGWEKAKVEKTEHTYCWENFLSMYHLQFISGMKIQFAELLHNIGFVKSPLPTYRESNIHSENINLIKAVICAGLYPNVAKLKYNSRGTCVQSIHTVGSPENSIRVGFHPKSVISREKEFASPWMIYHDLMKMNKVYLFDATIVSPYPLLFFGGSLSYHHKDGQEIIEVDHGIQFKSSIKTAKLILDLREELERLLSKKITNPKMQIVAGCMNSSGDEKVMNLIIELISLEDVATKDAD